MTFGKTTHGNHNFYSRFYYKKGLLVKSNKQNYNLMFLRYFLVLPP